MLLNLLNKHSVLLITGEPGVGKTTLAEMICLGYVGQEFEFVYADDISEAEDVFDKENPQIFLIDDFLGSNFLEFVEGKAESRIIRFINRVKAHKNKRLLLSSRTTIFKNALLRGVHLGDTGWTNFNCLLELGDYTYLERARLLYNHLCFRDLEITYLDSIKKDRRYLEIVKHKNFNPRLIEFITSSDRIKDITGNEYIAFVFDSLNNPGSIWEPAYRNQIGPEAKLLVQALFSLGGNANEHEVKDAFASRLRVEAECSNLILSDSPFVSAIRVLLDGFISRSVLKLKTAHIVRLAFINPSISDFMRDYINPLCQDSCRL